MSKIAAVVLAFLGFIMFATTSRAQILPSGNVYVGAAYGDLVDVIATNRYTFRGWNASVEAFPSPGTSTSGWCWTEAAFTGSASSNTTSLSGPGSP